MEVVCIKIGNNKNLTKGKVYDASFNDDRYWLKDDTGHMSWYTESRKMFITLEEHRKNRNVILGNILKE
jgi:hypothetical protein